MPSRRDSDTDELIRRVADGDAPAESQLLDRHRVRLKRMVMARMDQRLARRLDPSDIVQEVLFEAARKLPAYVRTLPLPFYPWLRQIAWNRLVDLHRRHILARNRSVDREVAIEFELSDHSRHRLVERLLAPDSAPSARLMRLELRRRVHAAIDRLPDGFREVLVLRQLEQLSVEEIAAVLGIAVGTVKSRHFRALAQLRQLLEEQS